jgi:hypothetical protein
MKLSPHWWSIACLAVVSRLSGGETLVVDGYAQQQPNGPILISLTPLQGTVISVPAAPDDRPFVPPSEIRWEVEITGLDSVGVRLGTALRTAPDDFEWPAGEEISPERYNGSLGGMFPDENELDPLGVAPGSGIPDYDQDGVPDAQDAFPGDPKESVDTDGDGIGDNADPDDDNDGMPDVWEIAHGTNPLVNDAAADPDHDGFSNLAEYQAGTDPQDARSFFHITQVTPVLDSVTITFDAVPGRTYTVLHLPTLSGSPKVLQSGITSATAQTISISVPKTTLMDFYYLQVSVTPTP